MDKNKDDIYFINKMKVNFQRIIDTMKNITYEQYLKNLDVQDITMFNLIQISENAKKISLEYKNKNQDIPWVDIYGLRNKIVHDYGNVDFRIVYHTLINDIPDLYKKLYS